MSRFALLPAWIIAIAAGSFFLSAYQLETGDLGTPNSEWPDNPHLTQNPNKPTLVMFVHPHCPCTRASLSELAILLTKCRGRVLSYVLLVQPQGVDESWVQTDLRAQAEQITGVTVLHDVDGAMAEKFGVRTSGETLLYDKAGQLIFCGGITPSRGHHGDSQGRRAVIDGIRHGRSRSPMASVSAPVSAPVYGCPLQNETTSKNAD